MKLTFTWSVPVLLAGLFFAVSLSPSLVPRPVPVQGLLSGLSMAAGYGAGVFLVWVWSFLQLPLPSTRWKRRFGTLCALLCAGIIVVFLWRAAGWQDTLRSVMGMEPVARTGSLLLAACTAAVFIVVMVLARLFRRLFRMISSRLYRILPGRISLLVGLTIAAMIFWTAVNGLLVRTVLRIADRSFQELDAWMDDDLAPPDSAVGVGGHESQINWKDLGRMGRAFVATGPTAADLQAFFGEPMPSPIRVYVGLNSAPTAEERAELALRELIRVGGFERPVLLLVTPTGTGWVDPAALDTVEYLHRGNIATVAAQYSYLNSPLALLTEAAYGMEMARTLFAKIYGYWRNLPPETRPRLYLHGLSLGALNSDQSFNLYDIIDDPFHGALWSGPPFRTESWRRMTAQRDPGTPAWLPQFRGGNVVRFMNQHGLPDSSAPWGSFRILFLQHGSDPITFFDPASAWREPDWLQAPRAHDVTPDLRWFPVVTMLQLAADMMIGTAPPGFGHEYAPADYIEAWHALTEPAGWSPEELERLKDVFSESRDVGEPEIVTVETLSRHETVAEFRGTSDHRCMGLTSRCPDACGHSGTLATFRIVHYVNHEKLGEFGDPKSDEFAFLVEDNKKNPKVTEVIRQTISALLPGDNVLLSWNHDYVTRNGNSAPERPVIRLEKIASDESRTLRDMN